MNTLIDDIIQIIFDLLVFKDQINFRLVCNYFTIHFPITNLYDNAPICKLTDKILKLYPFTIKLRTNIAITNINHLCQLRILDVRGCSGIGDNGIFELTNLTELYISCNSFIKVHTDDAAFDVHIGHCHNINSHRKTRNITHRM